MTVRTLRLCASTLALITAASMAAPAMAQDASAPDAASEEGTEIIVTAQKRAENVQSVPVSIAAFNAASLEKATVLTVMDLPRVASNFQSVRSSNTGSTRIGIRGVGSLANTLIEPSVAVFVDGVYVPRSGSILGSFLDIEGVEVLRGPQGTLFGRNASVGALSLRTATPKQEFSGELGVEIGSFERYKLSGHFNAPLGENVAVRVAGMVQKYDGPWKNKLDGKKYGGSDDYALRGSIKADLGSLEWILRADYTKLNGDGVANFDLDPTSVSAGVLAALTNSNRIADTNLNDRVMNQFIAAGLVDKNWGISSTASLDLGGSTLKLINSYRVWNNDQLDGDIIFLPLDIANRRSLFESKSHNHELQFISPAREWLGGKFDMVAGVHYFAEDFALSEVLNLGANFCNLLVNPAGPVRDACNAYRISTGGLAATDQDVFQNVKSFAVYGQGNIHLADQLTLTLGGRWTNDKKRGTFAQVSSPFTQTLRATEALTFPALSESRFTYRVSLNYKPSDDVMLFANHSTGYKSGGYNSGGGAPALTPPVSNRVFNRETVKNYELGIKSTWLDRKLKLNLTLYQMDIGGFQDRAFDGVSFIVRNAGSLRQKGFEFDTVVSPMRNFSITGSVAYLDSKFTSYANGAGLPGCAPVGGVIPAVCTPLPAQGQVQNLTGQPNTFSPKWMGNVAADLTGDFGSGGMGWALNANVAFVSSQYVGTSLDGNPQTLAKGYALLGARAAINGPDDRWSISVYARNLTNKHYRPLMVNQPLAGPLGLNNGVATGSTAVRVMASEPRSWGVSANVKF